MKKLFLLICLYSFMQFSAQEYKNYTWEKPENYTPTAEEKDQGQISILDKTISEFFVDGKDAYDFVVRHTKTYVNSDEAIERNNKVYIPFKSSREEIVSQKVRVIKPDGKVIELSQQDVQETEDERTKTKIKYFALKGLEKNSVIEQVLIGKYVPKIQGNTVVLQDEYINKNVSFEIIYPKHLEFITKSYNGLADLKLDKEKYKDKISQSVEVASIPALREEEYGNYIANAKKFSYKLTANHYNAKYDLFNYKSYTEDIFSILDKKPDSKAIKAVDKLVSSIPAGKTTAEKIRNVESYLKKNFQFEENYDGETDILTTLSNKFTNSLGLLILYKSVYDKLGINNQTIITSNRFKNPIDPKFEMYRNLDEFVLYFPETQGYVSPSEIDFRHPVLPYRWTNSYAVFLKKTEFGGASIPDYDIKKIKTPGIDFTHDEMIINVDFAKNSAKPIISTNIYFNGYTAFNFQPIYDFIPSDKVSLFEKDLAENYAGTKDNVKISSENKGSEFVGIKPYVLKVEFEGNSMVEKVGDKILFKVGETIGRQTELYQKDKRQMPIEIDYPHDYDRTITITLPAGYSVKNLDQINSNFVVNHQGKEVAKFATTHEVKGNQLIIKNVEFYKEVELPINLYDDYVKVINAAADFNKLVLVLQKN